MDSDLTRFSYQFEEWILKDIKYLLNLEDYFGISLEPDRNTYKMKHRPFVAATILICCAIDVLAAFRYGKENAKVGDSFREFVKNYFTKEVVYSGKSYDQSIIYKGLRNALLHGYSLNRDLALVHNDSRMHLTNRDSRLLVDVFSLYFDLEKVYYKYKEELQSGLYLDEFKKRWIYAPLLEYIPDENLKGRV